MTRPPFDSQPEVLRRLADEPLPSDSHDASPERRDRLVRAMRDAVEKNAEQAERGRRLRLGVLGVAAAAGFLLLGSLALRDRLPAATPQSIADVDAVSGMPV